MKKEELKACPFCGTHNPSLKFNSECDWWYLQCDKCNASIGLHEDVELKGMTVSEDARYEIEEYEDCMEFVDNGEIKGLEPLFERWNRRTP